MKHSDTGGFNIPTASYDDLERYEVIYSSKVAEPVESASATVNQWPYGKSALFNEPTFQDQVWKLQYAWGELFDSICKELRIPTIVEWVSRLLNQIKGKVNGR